MNKPKIFVLGTSVSMHYGPYLEQALGADFSYARKTGLEPELADFPELQTANSRDSHSTKHYLTLMQESLKTDILILGTGLHDIRRNKLTNEIAIPIETYRTNLQELINLGRNVSRHIIWVTTTSFDETIHNARPEADFLRYEKDHENYDQAAREVMQDNNIPIIDLMKFTQDIPGEKYIDHVHFIESVRERQGNFIAREIKNRFLNQETI